MKRSFQLKLSELREKFGINNDILELYANVFKCENFKCNKCYAMNYPDHENCYVPRDFFGYFQKPKKILVIGINPGKMFKSEIRRYKQIHPSGKKISQEEAEKLVYAHLEFAEEVFQKGMHIQDNSLRLSFHKDFPEAVSKVLDIQPEEIFDYIYYTTMIKCQTKRPLQKLKLEDREYLIKKCFELHLKPEIELLKPELILTYGQIVYDSLPWRDLIPIKVFNLPRIWAEASFSQRKTWRDQLDVMRNNISPIVTKIKNEMKA